MKELYQAFEAETQKPGKTFHELVRRSRRELDFSVPPEERVLPFRPQPSVSLPAIDLVIDHDLDDPQKANSGQMLALLRNERRLEELEIAQDGISRLNVREHDKQGLNIPERTRSSDINSKILQQTQESFGPSGRLARQQLFPTHQVGQVGGSQFKVADDAAWGE